MDNPNEVPSEKARNLYNISKKLTISVYNIRQAVDKN